MGNKALPEGVTILKRPRDLVTMTDEQLRGLLDSARSFLTRAEDRNYKLGYRRNQIKGMTGEYVAGRHVMGGLPPGSQAIWVPRRNVNVDILDGLIRQPDGTFVVIEAKYQTGGGNPRLGATTGRAYWVDENGVVTRIRTKGANPQLSHEWIRRRIDEIDARAAKLPRAERRSARQLARDLRKALKNGNIRALAVSVNQHGVVDVVEDRTRALYREVTSRRLVDTGRASGKPSSRATSSADRGTRSRGTADDDVVRGPTRPHGPVGFADDLAGEVVDLRKGTAKLAGRFEKVSRSKPGFTGNIILQVATVILFEVLRGKLAKANVEVTASLYASDVYRPLIEKHVVKAVELGRSGQWAVRYPEDVDRYVYILHSYEVLMNQEAETLEDFVVIVAGGFEIAETVDSVRTTKHGELLRLSRKRALPDDQTHVVDKRRPTDRENVVAYRHRRATLIYSPRVATVWRRLEVIHEQTIGHLNRVAARLSAAGYGRWVQRSAALLADQINAYAFLAARQLVDAAIASLPTTYAADLRALDDALRSGDRELGLMALFGPDETALLAAYLGIDPYESRRKIQAVQQQLEDKRKRRERRRAPDRPTSSRMF